MIDFVSRTILATSAVAVALIAAAIWAHSDGNSSAISGTMTTQAVETASAPPLQDEVHARSARRVVRLDQVGNALQDDDRQQGVVPLQGVAPLQAGPVQSTGPLKSVGPVWSLGPLKTAGPLQIPGPLTVAGTRQGNK